MSNVQAPIYFDRRVPGFLIDALGSQGELHALTQMARGYTLLDLQFHGNGKGEGKVTLYLGLTALMSIRAWEAKQCPPQCRLVPHAGTEARSHPDPILRDSWEAMDDLAQDWMTVQELGSQWDTVKAHLELLIPAIKGRWTAAEGAVQSTLELTHEIAVIDREVVLGYESDRSFTR